MSRYDDGFARSFGREDAYVLEAMTSGRLRYDSDFLSYVHHPLLILAYYENASRNGFFASYNRPGGPAKLRADVLSGEFARRRVRAREATT